MIAANALGRVSRVPAPAMQVRGAPLSPVDAMTPPRVEIQGETLRTWAFKSPAVEKVQVDLSTLGRPLEATVEVWNAAGNTPVTPLRGTTSLQLQNRAQLKADREWEGSVVWHCCERTCRDRGKQFGMRYGGALDCHLLSPFRTQFQARVYSEDGEVRPINVVLETPRGPSTVAVRNIGQVPRAGWERREAERSYCARPHGESVCGRYSIGVRCGPCWGADGIPDERASGRNVRAGAVP